MERAAELEPWTKQLRTMDHPDFDFALILWADGDKIGSRERLERLLERAEHSGDYSSLPFILTNLAGADFRDANLGLARERLDRAERLTRATGQWTSYAHMLTAKLHVAARTGDEAEARRLGDEALRLIARIGWNEGHDLDLCPTSGSSSWRSATRPRPSERFDAAAASLVQLRTPSPMDCATCPAASKR